MRDFVVCLRQLKVWAGDPSFEVLRRRCGVPSSTLADAVRTQRNRLPRLEVVRQFVRACGVDDTAGWEHGWRRVRERQDNGGRVSPPKQRPHWLPSGISTLTGREDLLERLDLLHREGAEGRWRNRLALIVGPAGVGKTALALHWAHLAAWNYPGGQLYLDLRGSAAHPAMAPAEALLLLIAALGVPAREVPAEPGARVNLYRSLTYSRRLLVLLDNARDAEQVRPLLPGGQACMTLVTSRNRLSALVAGEGGARLRVVPLDREEAVNLIVSMIGERRVRREPSAVHTLVGLCGCLPLALRIAGAHLADHPNRTIADYTAQLAGGNRLTQLVLDGDEATAVRAAFDISYAPLPGPTRSLFRQLAFAPEPDFTVDDAVRVTRRPYAEVSRLVEDLVAAHLVESNAPGRYSLHTLLKLYASSLAGAEARSESKAS